MVDAAVFAPYTLTLLGHLHRPQKVAPNAWYAGAPLRYSFSELDHDKVFTLFDLDATGAVSYTTVPVRPRRELRELTGTLIIYSDAKPKILSRPKSGSAKLGCRRYRIHQRPFVATAEHCPFAVELNPDAHHAGVDQDAGLNVASNDDLRAGEDDARLLLVPLLLADHLRQLRRRLVDQLLGE